MPIFLLSHMPSLGPMTSMHRVRRDFLKSSVSKKSAHNMGSMRCSIMYWPPIFSGISAVSLSSTGSGVISWGFSHLSHLLATKSLTAIEVSADRHAFLLAAYPSTEVLSGPMARYKICTVPLMSSAVGLKTAVLSHGCLATGFSIGFCL